MARPGAGAEPRAAGGDLKASLQRRGGRPGKIEKPRDARRALLRLSAYILPLKASISLVVALILLSSLFGLCGPYLMGRAIDRFIGAGDPGGLFRTALLMLGSYLASGLAMAGANWIMARASQLALKRLRADLFARMQGLSMSFFDANAAGGLMSRLTNDIDAVNQAVSQNVTALVASAFGMVGILGAMFALNAALAAASLVVVPIMFGFARFVSAFTRKGYRELQSRLGALNGAAEEAIAGQRVIAAFRRGDSVAADFRAKNQAVYEAAVRANSFAMLLMPFTQVLGSFFVVVLAGFGSWLALRGAASVGAIASFVNYGQNFTSPLRQIANLYNSIQAALAGAERVFEIIDAPPASADEPGARPGAAPPGAAPPSTEAPARAPAADCPAPRAGAAPGRLRGGVSFRDVRFSYAPGSPIIRGFDLEVGAGQTVALVGPTGAGKTTIINLLTRFYEIQGGAILVDGRDIRTLPKAELRRNLGLVLQDNFLFSGSVIENIRYGRLEARDEDCVEAARIAEADHFIRQLPRGYQTALSERAGNLSQGQRQLLAIARAVLSDPAILILDEATSSVDTRTEARIQAALLRLMRGRTSFVIAHRLSTIRDADCVVVIDGGEIVEKGTHDELIARRGFFHRLYMSQFKGNAI